MKSLNFLNSFSLSEIPNILQDISIIHNKPKQLIVPH